MWKFFHISTLLGDDKESDMSYFVTVTFDLNYADANVYPKIHDELELLDFSKFVSGRRKFNVPLPRNTFVAEFYTDEFERSSEVRDWLKHEINTLFSEYNVSGKYFIAVGKNWAWSVGEV